MAWHGMASMSAINADHTEGWVCATHDVGVLTPSYSGMIQQAEQDRAACPCGMLYRIEYLGRPGHPPGLGPAPAPPRHSPESGLRLDRPAAESFHMHPTTPLTSTHDR